MSQNLEANAIADAICERAIPTIEQELKDIADALKIINALRYTFYQTGAKAEHPCWNKLNRVGRYLERYMADVASIVFADPDKQVVTQ